MYIYIYCFLFYFVFFFFFTKSVITDWVILAGKRNLALNSNYLYERQITTVGIKKKRKKRKRNKKKKKRKKDSISLNEVKSLPLEWFHLRDGGGGGGGGGYW